MSEARRVRLTRKGRNQAITIPRGLELPGGEAWIRKEGDRLIIEAAPRLSLMEAIDELQARAAQLAARQTLGRPPQEV